LGAPQDEDKALMALRKFLILRRPPLRDAACGGSSGQGGRLEDTLLVVKRNDEVPT
jgi:hypothetical protein